MEPKSFTPTIDLFTKYVHPDDRELVKNEMQNVISKGTPVNFDFRIIAADGSVRVLNSNREIAERDKDGKPLLIVGTSQDVTDRKRIEDELIRSNTELQQFA